MSKVRIYLGEVETTRKIKKLVLTGLEEWTVVGSGDTKFFYTSLSKNASTRENPVLVVSSHFERGTISTISTDVGVRIMGETQLRVRPENVSATTKDDFTDWLKGQYSAGTPVTVWYVLATPETAVVNEPIRKIGTYADEVSGISIPVTAGGDTLSVDTTVQPSEVTVNYKGWHPVTDVHERENGAWT